LNFSRSWVLNAKEQSKVLKNTSFKSITETCKGKLIIDEKFLSDFVKDFNLKRPLPQLTLKDFYMSEKSGPQGPASKTAMMNLPLYTKEEKSWLLNLVDGKFGKDLIELSFKEGKFLGESPKLNCLGKLSVIHDPEAKVRLIAISDYYTQLVLKPLHDCILQLLKGIKSDRTFTQLPFHK